MRAAQKLWWDQAKFDHDLFLALKRGGAAECHLLHYLQMATEKLSKAYLWRSGHAPPKSHTGFVRLLRALMSRPKAQEQIAHIFGFKNSMDLYNGVRKMTPLAYSLQNIAPAQAGNGPNPEYPWPHDAPAHSPIAHKFILWDQLHNTWQGRDLLRFIGRAITSFDKYA